MAATRSHKCVVGEQLEDRNKIPNKIQKELGKIAQKNRNKRNVSETMSETRDVPELPFVNVPPLPTVVRGQTKTNSVPVNEDSVEKLLDIPKLPVEPSLKTRLLCDLMSVPKIWYRMH